LKGACDGGINIPHKTKRFPGYKKAKTEIIANKRGKAIDAEKIEAKFEPKIHRGRIYGDHVTTYMNKLKKEDPEKYKRQFAKWDKCLTANKAKTCEDIYKKVHSAIIADPSRVKKAGNKKPTRKVITAGKALVQQDSKGRKWIRHFRITTQDRKVRVAERFAKCMANTQK